MPLVHGDRLGPYVIEASLGAGGMGEVYRARDSRLGRDVAVKVLPSSVASDPHLRLRFEREAKTISGLSHPNICALFDFGEARVERNEGSVEASVSSLYLVMELIEGESLAERLLRGPLKLDQALEIGAEIASALDKAHRSGVVHRDLKPGNIMLTRTGAKLLDFGLARRVTLAANVSSDESTAFNDSDSLTAEGAIIGTFNYMAPEQLEGKDADARTDIFALGEVLYEMVTGRRPFHGKTRTSVIAAIMERQPEPVRELTPLTPPALEHVILKCLAKDRDERWQSAHDVAEQLRWIARGVDAAPEVHSPRWSGWAGWIAAAALAVLAIAAMIWRPAVATAPATSLQFTIAPPENGAIGHDLAISPDGKAIVFRAAPAGQISRLWIRSIDSVDARPLQGTEGAEYPFWSPDGRRLGFFAGERLRRIDIATGEILTICEARGGGGASWGAGDVIVFAPDWDSALRKVSAGGGTPVELIPLDPHRGDSIHVWPHFLPDGKTLLFAVGAARDAGIYAATVDGVVVGRVLPIAEPDELGPAIYSEGHLIYLHDLALHARPFDPRTLEFRGEPVRITESLTMWGPGRTNLAAAAGLLAFREDTPPRKVRFGWYGEDGAFAGFAGEAGAYSEVSLAPDESQAAVSLLVAGARPQLVVLDLERSVVTRLFAGPRWHGDPLWSRDGRTIYYSAAVGSPPNIFSYERATGEVKRLMNEQRQAFATDITLDGERLIIVRNDRLTGFDLFELPLSAGEAVPLIRTAAAEGGGRISPDGRWFLWYSDEGGRSEVYLTAYPALVEKARISPDGGTDARWSRDGRRIFYRRGSQLMAVDFTPGSPPRIGTPREILSVPFRSYDVGRASGRLLVSVFEEPPAATPIRVIMNWPAILER